MFHYRRQKCNSGTGETPLYVNVHMNTGETMNTWIDALQAAFSGVQVFTLPLIFTHRKKH